MDCCTVPGADRADQHTNLINVWWSQLVIIKPSLSLIALEVNFPRGPPLECDWWSHEAQISFLFFWRFLTWSNVTDYRRAGVRCGDQSDVVSESLNQSNPDASCLIVAIDVCGSALGFWIEPTDDFLSERTLNQCLEVNLSCSM